MKTAKEKSYVYQYSMDFVLINIHASIMSAAKLAGISNTSIYKAISGERNLAGGYFWYRGSQPLTKMPQKWFDFKHFQHLGSPSKPVLQYDKNGTLIAYHESIRKAAKALNVQERGISLAASGRYKTAYGYKWIFSEEENIAAQ